jgi:BirA family biotin operon repressor/biotin-[acetyl-CoA-carboxylase] ligase
MDTARVFGEKIGIPTFVVRKTRSTNSLAKRLLRGGIRPPFFVLALLQNAGHGQRGNVWRGDAVGNLYLSHVPAAVVGLEKKSARFIRHVAVKICAVLREKFSIAAGMKPPNDIFVGGGKAGGLLLEIMRGHSTVTSAVLGVGLNILAAPNVPDAPYAISCLQNAVAGGLDFATVAVTVAGAIVEAVEGFDAV